MTSQDKPWATGHGDKLGTSDTGRTKVCYSCCWDSKTSKPCCPRRISFRKDVTASQITGETSTPPMGGMAVLVGARTGSVGAKAMM